MHAVSPPMTGNYMPYGPDIEVDYSQFTYGPKQTQPSESESQISEFDTRLLSDALSLRSMKIQIGNCAKNPYIHSQKPKVDKKELGYGFTSKGRKANLEHVHRGNKQNQFVPSAVLTRTGKIPVSTARASGTKNVSTARQSVNSQTVLTSTAMKVNTVKPIVNRVRPSNVFHKTHSPSSRPFKKTTVLSTNFSKQKVNTAKVKVVSTVGGKGETAVKPSAGLST
ncbi:hypothetical protein Tco_1221534 [Tanacetum coccineum]